MTGLGTGIRPPLRLPPVYRPVAVAPDSGDDVLARACALAADGAAPGTLAWASRPDRLDCAVVLAPDRALSRTRPALLVAMVALGDALGALGPPRVRVGFGWPDRVAVNGALVGGARFAAPHDPADGVPPWAVVGVAVDVLGDLGDDAPGRHPERSSLREEGFEEEEVDAGVLLASFGRHLLFWMGRWQEDGWAVVRDAWLARREAGEGQERATLDETGDLLVVAGPEPRRLELARAVLTPTWGLPEATMPRGTAQ